MSITTQKSTTLKKVRKQGFRARMADSNGRKILNNRRQKGRKSLAFSTTK